MGDCVIGDSVGAHVVDDSIWGKTDRGAAGKESGQEEGQILYLKMTIPKNKQVFCTCLLASQTSLDLT